MSTDTPEHRAEARPEWAPLPPSAPKPPRDLKRIALVAGAITLAVILIATTVFALRGQSRPTTAPTAPTATSAPTATTARTATTVPTATPEPGAAPAAPLSVYVASSGQSPNTSVVAALNPADGTVRWQSPSFPGSAFSVKLSNNRVFVLSLNGPLIALQALDGKELWRIANSRAISDPALDGDTYYVAANGDSTHNGTVVAYSAASGTVLWQKDLGLNANPH